MAVNTSEACERDTFPLISVVIPCYNPGPFLQDALDSVLDQDDEIEIVVQDGGSTDGTVELLQSYGEKIRFESEPDSGQSQALNRALSRASGEFIGWLNADDYYASGTFGVIRSAIDENPKAKLFFGDFAMVQEDGQQLRRYYVPALRWERLFSHGLYIWSGASFFHKELFQEYGGFDESLHYCMDLEFLLRVGKAVESVHIPQTLGCFRLHDASKSGGVPLKFVRESHRVYWRYGRNAPHLRLTASVAGFRRLLYLSTRSLWLSQRWSSMRSSKKL